MSGLSFAVSKFLDIFCWCFDVLLLGNVLKSLWLQQLLLHFPDFFGLPLAGFSSFKQLDRALQLLELGCLAS
jgi:hypothetical protein